MSETTSNFFSFLGRPVKNEYGNVIGTIASFKVTPAGRVNGVFIEHSDGQIHQYSSDLINTRDGEVILNSTLKMRANSFCNQIPLLWRKTQAIKDLNERKRIPDELYGDLYSSFEGALNQLKAEAEETIADVESEVKKCSERVKELNSALINLEIEREIGQVDEEAYQNAIEIVREGLKRVNAEKTDFETLKSSLSNMLLGETTEETPEQTLAEDDATEMAAEPQDQQPSTPPISSDEPPETSLPEPPESSEGTEETMLPEPPESSAGTEEPPVVVYVKNAEESSSQ